MSHSIYFTVFSTLLLVACSNDLKKSKTYLQEENLKGNVKKYKEWNYSLTEDKKFELLYVSEHSIDHNGNRFLVEEYSPKMIFDSKCNFEHDERNNVTSLTNYDENGKVKSTSKLLYDNHNSRIEHILKSKTFDLDSKYSYTYDENGNPIQEIFYSEDGTVYSKDDNSFDEKGNLVKAISFRKDTLHVTMNFKYDVNGNLIERKDVKPDGSLDRHYKKKYDSKNNLIEEIYYDWQGEISSKTNYDYKSFDDKGNWLEKLIVENGGEREKKKRTYEYY